MRTSPGNWASRARRSRRCSRESAPPAAVWRGVSVHGSSEAEKFGVAPQRMIDRGHAAPGRVGRGAREEPRRLLAWIPARVSARRDFMIAKDLHVDSTETLRQKQCFRDLGDAAGVICMLNPEYPDFIPCRFRSYAFSAARPGFSPASRRRAWASCRFGLADHAVPVVHGDQVLPLPAQVPWPPVAVPDHRGASMGTQMIADGCGDAGQHSRRQGSQLAVWQLAGVQDERFGGGGIAVQRLRGLGHPILPNPSPGIAGAGAVPHASRVFASGAGD